MTLVHGLDHKRAKWGKLASTYIMMGEKNAARFADEIIVLSRGVQQYFWDTYNRKTRFIPNGVNRPQLKEPQLIKEKFGLKKKRIPAVPGTDRSGEGTPLFDRSI